MRMSYNTGRAPSGKLDDPRQLPSNASEFYPIHRRSLNIQYENVHRIENILSALSMQYDSSLLLKNLTRDELSIIAHRYDILNSLNDDEKTLALYLHKVLQNDPLTTGVRTDSFVNYLLMELRFNKYPFLLNLQPDYSFQVYSTRITAKVEFSIEKNNGILCFDEDKHLHSISSTTEYGESQIGAEILACAFTNYDKPDSPTRGRDQTIFAMRVIGSRFTLYKAFVSKDYIQSLNEGFPPEDQNVNVMRFPPNANDTSYGYDYANENHRPLILDLLVRLREYMRGM
jgi:hypothetical protein